jgi:hypothetical protein
VPRSDNLQFRRDTAADWTSANPVLREGEPGFELDTGFVKVGDGTTAWVDLPYLSSGGSSSSSVLIPPFPSGSGEAEQPNFIPVPPDSGLYLERAGFSSRRFGTLSDGIYEWGSGAFTPVTDITTDDEYHLFDWRSSASDFSAATSELSSGWLNQAAVTSAYWAGDIPAGTSLTLPPGVYSWTMYVHLVNPVPPDKTVYCYLDGGDNTVVARTLFWHHDGLQPNDVFDPNTVSGSGMFLTGTPIVVVPTMYVWTDAAPGGEVDVVWFKMMKVA